MTDQRVPCACMALKRMLSSSALQGSLTSSGRRWWIQRSLHCLEFLPGTMAATCFQGTGSSCAALMRMKATLSRASSSVLQRFLLLCREALPALCTMACAMEEEEEEEEEEDIGGAGNGC